MGNKKRFREIRVNQNSINKSEIELTPTHHALIREANQISFLFASKLRELDFRVDKFPIIYLLLELNVSEGEPAKAFPDFILKDVLKLVVGFPESFLFSYPDRLNKKFASFISQHLMAVSSRIGPNDSNLIKTTESLIVEQGLELTVLLLEKKTRRYNVKVFFKCTRKAMDPQESCVIRPEGQDYTARVDVHLEILDKKIGVSQTRFLFETSPLLVYLIFTDAVISDLSQV